VSGPKLGEYYTAFKLVKIPVTRAMIEEENEVIKYSTAEYELKQIAKRIQESMEPFYNLSRQNDLAMKEIQNAMAKSFFKKDDLEEN
jgi:hypothetical protein